MKFIIASFIATNATFGVDVELRYEARTDRALPTATAVVVIDGKEHRLESSCTGSDDAGVVSKDGSFVVYTYHYDSNHDGAVDFRDQGKTVVLKINDDRFDKILELENSTGMLDINSDNTKLAVILGTAGQLSLERIDLTTLKREVKIPKAQWLGHPKISPDDKYLALFVSDKALNIDNQVLLIDSKGAKTVSGPVGNGWMLLWLGPHLMFTEQGKPIVFDSEKNTRVAPESMAGVNASVLDKHKSGWPKKSPR